MRRDVEMALNARDFYTPRPPREVMGQALIIEPLMVDKHEDWSKVRSPGRARRREARGFRQRIRRWETPRRDVLTTGALIIMHPTRWPSFALELAQAEDFNGRARRAGVDLAYALKVKKHWRWLNERGRSAQKALYDTGVLRISIDDAAGLQYARVNEAVPEQRAYKVDVLTAILLRNGRAEGMGVVWEGLLIDEVWL